VYAVGSTVTLAVWVMKPDRPRYLGRVGGYVETTATAIDPVECVDADYQRELSQRARLDELRRTREAWTTAEEVFEGAIGAFEAVADPRVRPAVRALRKARRRVARAVEALEPIDE
jgi:hypothetical protein